MTVVEYAWARILGELLLLGAGLSLFGLVAAAGYAVIVVAEREKAQAAHEAESRLTREWVL